MTSVFSRCMGAATKLAQLPQYFTEARIIDLAADDSWGEPEYFKARIAVQQIARTLYTRGKIARFGPVHPPDMPPDYARMRDDGRSQIVMVGTKRVHGEIRPLVPHWETPNGTFPALLHVNDGIGGSGRRVGSNRDDSILWGQAYDEPEPEMSEADRLRADLRAAHRKIEEIERDRDHWRSRALASPEENGTISLDVVVTPELLAQLRQREPHKVTH